MKIIPVEEAVGMVLCHDMTRIVPGEYKGPAFRKGHVVTADDIPTLLRIGKEHIYVLDLLEGQIHEDEAAIRIAKAAAGPGLTISPVCEGRVNLTAQPGLLRVNVEALHAINSIEEVVMATMQNGLTLKEPRDIAGTRVVPLVVDEEKVRRVEEICAANYPVLQVLPLQKKRVGVVTTGSEIFHGRIKDKFGPVLQRKFRELGSDVAGQVFVGDETKMTREAIMEFVHDGADMVVVTGGMSVDPDDQTPASIRSTGAEIVTYGSPTFPGVMFLLAYLDGVPILGLPGCVMYFRASVFDLVVPRLLAGERVTREDIVALGHGGFCAGCDECRFPLCSFGKHG